MKCECGCGQEVKPGRRFVNHHCRRSHMWTLGERTEIADIMKGKNLGKKHTDKAKRKISKSQEGRQPALGLKHTPETLEKISAENSPSWKGGISFEPYCSKFNNSFKESVRDKFDRRCFLCGAIENDRKLDVHHVNYDKSCLCSEVECEFVPLCRSCHSKTNHSRDYYERLILAKLEV